MRIELDMPSGLEEQLRSLVLKATREAVEQTRRQSQSGEWLNLKEGAKYAGVSYNTFMKYRLIGLKICEIDGVKRVSKKAIDEFLDNNSF